MITCDGFVISIRSFKNSQTVALYKLRKTLRGGELLCVINAPVYILQVFRSLYWAQYNGERHDIQQTQASFGFGVR